MVAKIALLPPPCSGWLEFEIFPLRDWLRGGRGKRRVVRISHSSETFTTRGEGRGGREREWMEEDWQVWLEWRRWLGGAKFAIFDKLLFLKKVVKHMSYPIKISRNNLWPMTGDCCTLTGASSFGSCATGFGKIAGGRRRRVPSQIACKKNRRACLVFPRIFFLPLAPFS